MAIMAAMRQLLLVTETKRFQLDVLLRVALPPDVTFVLVFEEEESDIEAKLVLQNSSADEQARRWI